MTHYTAPDLVPAMDDDDDDENVAVRPPVVSSSKGAEEKMNPPTEYEVLELAGESPEALKKRLNELGEDGWALVATTPAFIFRRMKKTEEKKPERRVGFGIG
jgi:hypothetical protein